MYNPLIYPSAMPVVAASGDGSRPSGAVFDDSRSVLVIDGTPIRVVVLAGAAALAIVALRWSGFRFNVGVST